MTEIPAVPREVRTGVSGKARLGALIGDNILACILALGASALLPTDNPNAKGATVVLVYLGYFFVSEVFWSRTLFKGVARLKVEMLDGRRCTVGAALIRTILRVVEVNPLVLGALPGGIAVMASSRKQRLGDMLAGTIVVDAY